MPNSKASLANHNVGMDFNYNGNLLPFQIHPGSKHTDYGDKNNTPLRLSSTQPTAVSHQNQKRYQKYTTKLNAKNADLSKGKIKVYEIGNRGHTRQ